MVQHLRLSRRNRPAHFFFFFFFFFAATLQNFSFKQVCSRHTMRVQAQGEQLHQAHLVIHCTVIYTLICASEHFVTVTIHITFCLFVTIHITIVTHKYTSEQIHHHCLYMFTTSSSSLPKHHFSFRARWPPFPKTTMLDLSKFTVNRDD